MKLRRDMYVDNPRASAWQLRFGYPIANLTERSRLGERVRPQSGQALVETLVFAAVAAVLGLCLLMIARLQSIQSSAVGAARSLSLECRLVLDGCRNLESTSPLVRSLKARHFTAPPMDPTSSAATVSNNVKPGSLTPDFWRNPDGKAMLENLDSISIRSSSLRLDAGIATSGAGQSTVLSALGSIVGPNRFGLDGHAGLRLAEVEVPVDWRLNPNSQSGPLVNSRFVISARLAVVGDEWNASQTLGPAPDSLESRVAEGSRLDSFRETALTTGYAISRNSMQVAARLGLDAEAGKLLDHKLDVGLLPRGTQP